jgi:hypothetical protein
MSIFWAHPPEDLESKRKFRHCRRLRDFTSNPAEPYMPAVKRLNFHRTTYMKILLSSILPITFIM